MKEIIFILFLFALSFSLHAQGLDAQIDYDAERRTATNEKISDDEINNKIFSAPVQFNFHGTGGDDAIYYTWYIYKKEDLNNAIARYTDQDIRYIFEESGNFVIKLEVADNESNTSETSFEFTVTTSEIDLPNFFSPGNSDGSNDEYRVAYRSIVKFRMTIFNRWGVKIYESTDPAKGWDGRYKGKLVNTGVYYAIVEAEGADGIKRKLSRDINVLRSR